MKIPLVDIGVSDCFTIVFIHLSTTSCFFRLNYIGRHDYNNVILSVLSG